MEEVFQRAISAAGEFLLCFGFKMFYTSLARRRAVSGELSRSSIFCFSRNTVHTTYTQKKTRNTKTKQYNKEPKTKTPSQKMPFAFFDSLVDCFRTHFPPRAPPRAPPRTPPRAPPRAPKQADKRDYLQERRERERERERKVLSGKLATCACLRPTPPPHF